MSAQAQSGYYTMPPVARTLNQRVAAIADHIPPGVSIVDIGCNDGTILKALKSKWSQAIGLDLEDIRSFKKFEFKKGNINHKKTSESLPPSDITLLLNILHHVIGSRGIDRAREIVEERFQRSLCLFVDLGSFTERGKWGWRREYDEIAGSDEELLGQLFGDLPREAILEYPTQGQGTRTLWMLKHSLPGRMYRRTVAAMPHKKRLVTVKDWNDPPIPFGSRSGQLHPGVLFTHDGESWTKRQMGRFGMPKEDVAIHEWVAKADIPASSPEKYDPILGWVFEYDERLKKGPTYHAEHPKTQNIEGWEEVIKVARMKVDHPDLPKGNLSELTDFQAVKTDDGWIYLDFDPWPEVYDGKKRKSK